MGKAKESIKNIEPDEKKKLQIKIKELKENRDLLKTTLRWTIDEIKKKEQELVSLNIGDMFKKCPECGARVRLRRERGFDFWSCTNTYCDYVERIDKDGI